MRSLRRKELLVPLYFVVLTVAFTWPAALHLADSVVGQLGDNLHFAWLMGWFEEALFKDLRWPFFAPQLNFPEGWHLARSETTPLQAVMGLPFTRIGGPVLAYNLVALATFALSGWTTYFWVKRLTSDRLAGLIAGTLFACLPFRFAHYRVGHLNILGTMWFPLFFLAVLELLQRGTAPRRVIVLGAISLGLIGLTSQYFLYVTLVATAFASVLYLACFNRAAAVSRKFWTSVGLMVLIALPLVVAGTLPYFQLTAEESLPDRELQIVSSGSASVSDFLLPATDHFLLGEWVGEHFSRNLWVEGSLYLGAVGAGLSALALFRVRAKHRREIWFLVILFLVSATLALGTHVYWNEQRVRFDLPGALTGLLNRDSTAIPLPGYLFFKVLPYYAKMRTFKRAAAIALLAVSVLAGLGAAWLLSRVGRRWRNAAGVTVLALALLDFYPGPIEQFSTVEPRPVDLWLAEQPGEGAVAEFPFDLQEEQAHVYFSLVHGKPILGGFFNAFPPPQYRRLRPIMDGFPDDASVQELRRLGVGYVIVATEAFSDPKATIAATEQFGLVPAVSFSGTYVFVWSE